MKISLFSGLLLVSSPYIFGSAIVAPAEKNEVNEINSTIPLADQLFNQHSYTQLYDLLIQFKVNDHTYNVLRLKQWRPRLFVSFQHKVYFSTVYDTVLVILIGCWQVRYSLEACTSSLLHVVGNFVQRREKEIPLRELRLFRTSSGIRSWQFQRS